MVAGLVGPDWLSGALALAGAFLAGVLNPYEPVRAGLLAVAVPALAGLIRVLLDEPSALGVLVVAAVGGALLALVASHFAAGVQQRWLRSHPT